MKFITDYLKRLHQGLTKIAPRNIEQITDLLIKAREQGKQVFIFGNGGSAATASHMACDLGKGTVCNPWDTGERRLKAISLTDNMSHFSALANDEGYDQVFSHQLHNLLQTGDIVIGISVSGNSPNVINAFTLAKERDSIIVGFVGFDGGQMKGMCNYNLHFEENSYQLCEDAHLILAHIIMSLITSKHRD